MKRLVNLLKPTLWEWEVKRRLANLLKPTTGKVIGIAATAAVIGLIFLDHYRPDITGFGADSTTNVELDKNDNVIKKVKIEQSGKTLWDWLSVLGVPLTLAILGYWLQQLQQQRATEESKLQQQRAEEQAKLQKQQADEESKEEVLQGYFDRISTLLIDKNLIAVADRVQKADDNPQAQEDESLGEARELVNAAKDVIRGRTLSVLRRLGNDYDRKGDVIKFLADTEIASKCQLDLSGVNLEGVYLKRANLAKVNLTGADLYGANLTGADLTVAKLISASFYEAVLTNTDLKFANLRDANLTGADLTGANLTDAKDWTDEQLSKAILCKTTLPEGSKLDPTRDLRKLNSSP